MPKRNRIAVSCNECGKDVEVTLYQRRVHKNHYCKWECWVLHQERLSKSFALGLRGKRLNKKGYYEYGGSQKGTVLVHRMLMEKHLNRKLTKEEHVHHINHDKLDNRIENLQIVSAAEHLKLHEYIKRRPKIKASGVSKTPFGKWQAMIGKNYKSIFLGNFSTREEALMKRKWAVENWDSL